MIERLGAAMQAQWLRHELLANNLANAATPGFKKDDLILPAAESIPLPAGARVPAPPPEPPVAWTDFSPGPIRETGRDLDVALEGDGFLVVETPAGPRYTRGGALTVDGDGYLALPGAGRVLGDGGPIRVTSARVAIAGQGEVRSDGQVVGRLRIVDFPRPYPLAKVGHGLFAPTRPDAEPAPASGVVVVPGALEGANVNAVEAMVAMIESHRLFEAYQRVIQAADAASERAVNEIGRVS